MERIPNTPPQIAPLATDETRPLWSVMIPVYNCSAYIPEAIESVLMQDLGAALMQIEVVDDCSTDADIEELVKQIGRGRVSYYKQEKNVGSLRNFETCINRSRGRYIHLLHGDDKVLNGYYERLSVLFQQFPHAGAAYCAYNYINENSNLLYTVPLEANEACIIEDALYILGERQILQYVAISVKREVYEKLGSFYAVIYGEDWEMWSRIAKHYPIAYTPDVLAAYRVHQSSISSTGFLSGNNVKDIKKVFKLINSHLPEEKRKKALAFAKKNYTYWAIPETYKLLNANPKSGVPFNLIVELLKLYSDGKVIEMSIKLVLYSQIIRYGRVKRFLKALVKRKLI